MNAAVLTKLRLPGDNQSARPDRSCIEGGGDLMVTLRAPGPIRQGTAVATGACDDRGARRWVREGTALDGSALCGDTIMFMHECGGDFDEALDFLGRADARPEFYDRVTALRSCSRIYMATRDEPETGEGWLSFALDRRVSPRALLAQIAPLGSWDAACTVLSQVFGRAVTERTRPWSIALPFSEKAHARCLLRVGTAAWGRVPETTAKMANMADAINRMGGDGDRAFGDYASLLPERSSPARFSDATGSAAEVDIDQSGACGLMLTLKTENFTTRQGDA